MQLHGAHGFYTQARFMSSFGKGYLAKERTRVTQRFWKLEVGHGHLGKYPLVNEYSSGNLPFSSLIHLLKRVIFYGYVPSPEGILKICENRSAEPSWNIWELIMEMNDIFAYVTQWNRNRSIQLLLCTPFKIYCVYYVYHTLATAILHTYPEVCCMLSRSQ